MTDALPRPLKAASRPVELVSLTEAARRFGMAEHSLRRWATERKGQPIPFPPPLCIDRGYPYSTGASLWEWPVISGWFELHGKGRV